MCVCESESNVDCVKREQCTDRIIDYEQNHKCAWLSEQQSYTYVVLFLITTPLPVDGLTEEKLSPTYHKKPS